MFDKFTVRSILSFSFSLFVVMSAIAVTGLHEHLSYGDLGVVLGTTVQPNGQPSERLQARLVRTAELYHQHYFPLILCSGGLGKEGFDEPTVMRNTLINLGVPADCILLDSHGNTTYQTVQNTVALLQERHFKRVFIISQFFHLPRTRLAFQRANVKEISYAHAFYFEWRDLYSLVRESVAICFYLLRPSPAPL